MIRDYVPSSPTRLLRELVVEKVGLHFAILIKFPDLGAICLSPCFRNSSEGW